MSFEQSRIVCDDVLARLGEPCNLDDRKVWRKQYSSQRLPTRAQGQRCEGGCISSDPKTAQRTAAAAPIGHVESCRRPAAVPDCQRLGPLGPVASVTGPARPCHRPNAAAFTLAFGCVHPLCRGPRTTHFRTTRPPCGLGGLFSANVWHTNGPRTPKANAPPETAPAPPPATTAQTLPRPTANDTRTNRQTDRTHVATEANATAHAHSITHQPPGLIAASQAPL